MILASDDSFSEKSLDNAWNLLLDVFPQALSQLVMFFMKIAASGALSKPVSLNTHSS